MMHNKYRPVSETVTIWKHGKPVEDVQMDIQEYPASGVKLYSGELVDELRAMLQWYIDEDEVNEGQEGNEYWTEGKHKAIELLGRIE